MRDIPLRPGCSRLTSWRTTPLLRARATLRISWITDHPLSRRFPLRPSIPPSPVEEFIHEAPFAAPASQRQKVHSFTTTSRVPYDSTTSVTKSWQSDGGQFLLCPKIPSGCWFSERISVPLEIRSLGRSYLGNVSPLPDSFGISCSLDRKIIYSHARRNASLLHLLSVYVSIAKCEIFRFEGIGTFGRRHGSDIELNLVRVKSNHRVRDHVHHGHRRDPRSLRPTSLVKSTEIAAVWSVVLRTKMSGGS